MDGPWIVVLVLVGAAGMVFFTRVQEPLRRARFLKRAGMVVMGASSAFFALFVAGETFTDPGGWAALGLVAAWLVPLVVVAILAWSRPALGLRILTVLTVATVGLVLWRALDPGVRELEDRVGPFTTIAVVSVAAAATALAHASTKAAGLLLLILGVAPAVGWLLMSRVEAGLGTALALVTSPAPLAGILFLLSDRLARRAPQPGAGTGRGAPSTDRSDPRGIGEAA